MLQWMISVFPTSSSERGWLLEAVSVLLQLLPTSVHHREIASFWFPLHARLFYCSSCIVGLTGPLWDLACESSRGGYVTDWFGMACSGIDFSSPVVIWHEALCAKKGGLHVCFCYHRSPASLQSIKVKVILKPEKGRDRLQRGSCMLTEGHEHPQRRLEAPLCKMELSKSRGPNWHIFLEELTWDANQRIPVLVTSYRKHDESVSSSV